MCGARLQRCRGVRCRPGLRDVLDYADPIACGVGEYAPLDLAFALFGGDDDFASKRFDLGQGGLRVVGGDVKEDVAWSDGPVVVGTVGEIEEDAAGAFFGCTASKFLRWPWARGIRLFSSRRVDCRRRLRFGRCWWGFRCVRFCVLAWLVTSTLGW